jgi:hypothetical protein
VSLLPGNILDYNTQSIETDTTGWTVLTGPGTLTQSTNHHLDGTHCLLVTASGAGEIQIGSTGTFAVTPNTTYWAYLNVYNTTNRSILMEIVFYTSTGAIDYALTVPLTAEAIPPATWFQVPVFVTSSAHAATVTMVMRPQAQANGDLFSFDQMYVGPPALAFTVTPNATYAYNAISISGLTGWSSFSVIRTNPNGSQVTIRSANGISPGTADTWAGFDVEAPLGQACTYTVVVQQPQPDGTTTTYQISQPSVIIPVSPATGWLKSLSQSALNAQVVVQTLSDVKRPSRQQTYPVVGRANPVVVSDVLTGRTGTLSLMTTGTTDYQAVYNLLQPGTTLFFQATPGDNFTDMYFVPGDVTEQRPSTTSSDTTRIWQIDSYLAVVSFGTYQELLNTRSTYLAALDTPYGSGPGGI